MIAVERYFGTPEQQALERRADLLWRIVAGDPRYGCHGRAVALKDTSAEAVVLQIALARLQGVAPSDRLPREVAEARIAVLEAEGLVTDVYEHWQADRSALDRARAAAGGALPDGLALRETGPETPDADWARLDALTAGCGVLLPAAAFLTGARCPVACVYAQAPDGGIVAVAAAIAQHPPGTPDAGRVFWGMLSTAEAWRGRGLAKRLGAEAMIAIAGRHPVKSLHTGIRAGALGSERLCAGLGLSATDLVDLIAIDPAVMAAGRLTA